MLLSSAAAAAPPPASETSPGEVSDFFKRLSRLRGRGSLSLNWRNVGPRKPGFETQIQNEVYLADMYFGLEGPFLEGIPVQAEWHMPTAGRGSPQLNQLNFQYRRLDHVMVQLGKFLVPFGRYNELYRPEDFLAVTRPLLYASPDSLDLVVRLNSPRPPVSSGYTDVGGRISYYPPVFHPLIPSELTFFVVNGLGESNNRQRTFPNTDNLGIPSVPDNGVTIDFGHQNNNLADNNNSKSLGGRVVFALGDVRLPWPVPERSLDLTGMSLGFSGMGGQYELEGTLNYQMYGADLSFDYKGFNFSGEYMYSQTQFLSPLAVNGAIAAPVQQIRDFETDYGYFLQASFPLIRKPALGERVTGVLVFNQIFRRGPILDLFLNPVINGTTYPSVNAIGPAPLRVTRRLDKYTAAVNWRLNEHFQFKVEYSYWTMARASTRSVTSIGLVDIYQTAFSIVAGW
ncbi:MAG: hypothetical protein HY921_08640 [Elusimicrobia bacterium]|nr:hypothetical protein [Elusimicrobiota bacterium]